MMKKMLALLLGCVMLLGVCGAAEDTLSCRMEYQFNADEFNALLTGIGGEIPEEVQPVIDLMLKVLNKLSFSGMINEKGAKGEIALGGSVLGNLYINWEDGIRLSTDLLPSYGLHITAEDLAPVTDVLAKLAQLDPAAYVAPFYDMIAAVEATVVTEAAETVIGDVTYTEKTTYTFTEKMLGDMVNGVLSLIRADAEKLGLGDMIGADVVSEADEDNKAFIVIYSNDTKKLITLENDAGAAAFVITLTEGENGMNGTVVVGVNPVVNGTFILRENGFSCAVTADEVAGDWFESHSVLECEFTRDENGFSLVIKESESFNEWTESHMTLECALQTAPVSVFSYALRSESASANWKQISEMKNSWTLTDENTISYLSDISVLEGYDGREMSMAMKGTGEMVLLEDGMDMTSAVYVNGSETPLCAATGALRFTDEGIDFPAFDEGKTVLTIAELSRLSDNANADEAQTLLQGMMSELMGNGIVNVMTAFRTMPEEYEQIMDFAVPSRYR